MKEFHIDLFVTAEQKLLEQQREVSKKVAESIFRKISGPKYQIWKECAEEITGIEITTNGPEYDHKPIIEYLSEDIPETILLFLSRLLSSSKVKTNRESSTVL